MNHVVSGKNEILIAKWNDTTGALISVYGIACITSNRNFNEVPMGENKGCLTTADAVYIRICTEQFTASNGYTNSTQPIIMKLPHEIGSLAGNHTINGLTFTIGAATGVTQGSLTKNRMGFAEDGYDPLYNTSYDHSRDDLITDSPDKVYLDSGHPNTTDYLLDI